MLRLRASLAIGFAAQLALGCGGSEPRPASSDERHTEAPGRADEPPPRPPPPEPAPGDPTVACASDEDCTLAPEEPCRCPPCGYVWRRAVTRAHAAWIEGELATEECAMPECEACDAPRPPGGWVLGTSAACEGGACRVQ